MSNIYHYLDRDYKALAPTMFEILKRYMKEVKI